VALDNSNDGTTFQVECKSKKSEIFRARSSTIARRWVSALRKAMQSAPESTVGLSPLQQKFVLTPQEEQDCGRIPKEVSTLQDALAALLEKTAWSWECVSFLRDLQRGYLDDSHALQFLIYHVQHFAGFVFCFLLDFIEFFRFPLFFF
jgi:hypothetical protein